MKAVVVELNNNLAAILSDDGCVTTIQNKNYTVGQVIQIQKPGISIVKKLSALAASAAAFVILGTGIWAYASPYTYVSVDVNPSIEFSVNRFDRVIHVKAVNDDGENILKEVTLGDLKNKTIKEALVSTVDQIDQAGYFGEVTKGGIIIATSCSNTKKAKELADELKQAATQTTQENGDTVNVEAFSVALERVEEAKKHGVTPGKLNLVEKLQEAAGDSSIDIEEWLNKPVKDIMKATREYENETKKLKAASGQDVSLKDSSNAQESSGVSGDTDSDSGKSDKNSAHLNSETDENHSDNTKSNNGKDTTKAKSNTGTTNNKSKADKKQSDADNTSKGNTSPSGNSLVLDKKASSNSTKKGTNTNNTDTKSDNSGSKKAGNNNNKKDDTSKGNSVSEENNSSHSSNDNNSKNDTDKSGDNSSNSENSSETDSSKGKAGTTVNGNSVNNGNSNKGNSNSRK